MASSHLDAPLGFFNYPIPTAHDIPYQAPPTNTNPVLKGLPLYYLGSLVPSIPLLPAFLWRNAGFGLLRSKKELDNVEPRYDPTVIPVPRPEEPENVTTDRLRTLPKSAKGRFWNITDYHEAFKKGEITPVDVVETLFPLIRRDVDQRSAHATAFVETRMESVRRAADASAKRWKDGEPLGVLDGVPFAVKDDVYVKGYKMFVGTKHDYTEGKEVGTSWCVQKLEEAGAVLVGRCNMHEIGMDTTNNNPVWGTPLNPYNSQYYCGGSSGGAAYAVGQGIIPFAIGSDGGGSVRIPSNYCGIYGLKPSHGRVSKLPCRNKTPSTTVNGPLASNMVDLEVSYRALAQPDPSNHASRQFAVPQALTAPRKKVIGIHKAWFDRADPIVQDTCQSAINYFESELGYEIVDVSIPLTYEGQMAHAMTILTEGVAAEPNLSRVSPANKIVLAVAKVTTGRDLSLAQRVRNIIMQHLAHLFQTHPGLIIVTPTTPNAGWPIGEGELVYGMSDGNTQVRNMEYVWLANFTGVPCIQFPVGYVDAVKGEGRVPVGLSGHGEWGSEDALIEFGHDGERWLNEEFEGGRIRPKEWVDVIGKSKN
ncbi:amidase signature enzyme [Amniculicola lignicola CBS 123094]|uniref:Amidase signature enzyme n=1 Tax=Amniculicola lignicola CBS 123094 TaxID=1392246 RepID=A0A6A5WZ17_9PLEO|nr:amidase signature enzyme [Amniculicola lignicola CBS 123094]